MSKELIVVGAITLVIAALTGVITFLRFEAMTDPNQIAAKGLEAARRETVLFYMAVALVFAPIAFFIYRGMAGNAPETAPQTYLQVAIIAAVVLTVLAFLFFRRAVVEMTVFHVTYVIGFGWLMPVLLRT